MPEPGRRVVGALLRAAVVLGLSAAAGWAVGLDGGHLVAVALLAAAATAAVQVVAPPAVLGWPLDPEVDRGVGWHQVVLTSRMLEQLDRERDRVPRALLPRLRGLASARLARLGVPVGSPRVRDVLGAELYDLLDASTVRPASPSATDLTRRLLDRLDELDRLPENHPPEERDARSQP